MTMEEAKELLLHILMTYEPKDQYGDYDDPEPYEQALTMAIEVLSNCTTEKPNDIVEQKNDVVAEPTDLISRADALKAIDYRRKTANIDGQIILDEVEDRIRELPSADRPSGEWIYGADPITGEKDCKAWTCSICGGKYPWQPNYCPNCGADMRKEKNK